MTIIIDQTTHERQVSPSVSTLAVASVIHPEENFLSSPSAIMHANLRCTKPEQKKQNPSVSTCTNMFLAVTDDQQAQQSMSVFLPNVRNIHITDGTFVVSLC